VTLRVSWMLALGVTDGIIGEASASSAEALAYATARSTRGIWPLIRWQLPIAIHVFSFWNYFLSFCGMKVSVVFWPPCCDGSRGFKLDLW
jgi:hypothetical protein